MVDKNLKHENNLLATVKINFRNKVFNDKLLYSSWSVRLCVIGNQIIKNFKKYNGKKF